MTAKTRTQSRNIADWLFAAIVTGVAWFMAVALARWAFPSAPWAGFVLGTLATIALPMGVDAWLTNRYRRIERGARGTYATTLVGWNLVVGLLIAFVSPRGAKAALPDEMGKTATAMGLPGSSIASAARRVLPAGGAEEGVTTSASSTSSATATATATASASASARSLIGVATPPPAANTPAGQVFQDRAPAVVVLSTIEKTDDSIEGALMRQLGISVVRATGSGFVVKSDSKRSLIVTNFHVAGEPRAIGVAFKDGRTVDKVRRIATSRDHDLALIEVELGNLPIAPLATTDDVSPGARAIAIGAPLGLDYTLTEGIISAKRSAGSTTMLQTQTTIDHGSSGGPLFDERGQVIGVNTATKGAGLNLAVSVKHVRELLAAPPKPQALDRFTPGPKLKELTVEGGSLSAIDRLTIDEASEAIFSLMESCLADAPAQTSYEVRVPVPTDDPFAAFRNLPGLTAPGRGSHCFDSPMVSMGAVAVGQRLRSAMGDSAKDGGLVRIVMELATADGGPPRQLELRFVLEK